jgi:hypothetical protein
VSAHSGYQVALLAQQIEIRLDANGAFTQSDVHARLRRLAAYHIHSESSSRGQTAAVPAHARAMPRGHHPHSTR